MIEDRVGQVWQVVGYDNVWLLLHRADFVDPNRLTWDAVGWQAVDLADGRPVRVHESWIDRGTLDGRWRRLL